MNIQLFLVFLSTYTPWENASGLNVSLYMNCAF